MAESDQQMDDSKREELVIEAKKYFEYHKESIASSVRKGKCSMYPSCSAYAKEAFNRLSFFKACTAVSERLIRCGRDSEDKLKIIKINNRLRINDPVPE